MVLELLPGAKLPDVIIDRIELKRSSNNFAVLRLYVGLPDNVL